MAEVGAEVVADASLAEAWELFFDQARWRSWVDGFEAVAAIEGWPGPGGTLRWRSVPAGRGVVTERVLEHDPRTLHRAQFRDDYSEGELETRFSIEPGGAPRTRVSQRLSYRLLSRGPFAILTERIFVRPQVRRSLERSLARFAAELSDAGGG